MISTNELAVEEEQLKERIEFCGEEGTHLALAFNAEQLWYVYLGLKRLKLAPELSRGTRNMAKQVRAYGKKYFKWV